MAQKDEPSGRGKIEGKEEILNVLRESDEESLTTPEITARLPIEDRTVQTYVRELEDSGRLVLESEGRPNHWRLSDTEPKDPVYRAEYARARRISNKASKTGNKLFLYGVAVLASIGIVTTTNIYSQGLGIPIGLLRNSDSIIVAGLIGVTGFFLFLAAFVSYFVALALPRAVEWYIDGKLPEEARK
jgi:hypothetical protein